MLLGRASGYCMSSLIGLKRSLCTNFGFAASKVCVRSLCAAALAARLRWVGILNGFRVWGS